MNEHVLVVEDSRTQAEVLRGDLEAAGYRVTVARDGQEALGLLDGGVTTDLVISDVVMPGMDGYALCRHLKADRRFDVLPVLLLTSLRDPIDIVRALEAGADNFLTKPYDPARLFSRIEAVLGSFGQRGSAGRFRMGAEVRLLGHRFTVDADRQQILDLLMGSLEDLVYANARLREREEELVRARHEAVTANREKSRFIAKVAHELRTPLGVVKGYAELLTDTQLAQDDKQAVEAIANNAQHLARLIDDLVDVGRVEAGELAVDLEPVDVSYLLREALQSVEVLAEQRNIHLPRAGDTLSATVHTDPVRLRQVLTNLLSNAVKYNRPGGRVSVECRPVEHGRVQIDVSDTGYGIPPELLGRVFVPFDRLGAEHSDVEGSGIGLALVRDLVEAMAGTVTVASTSPEGTTFRIELPAATDHEEVPT